MSRLATPAALLSCDRIQAKFGSYGVDVLASNSGGRVSSLYSLMDGEKVCRTYARVRFAREIDPAFAAEHARIVAGESIGTVFQSAGWTIAKRHRHIGETALPCGDDAIPHLMRIEGNGLLATHTYVFEIAKDGRRFDYAVITELHHPSYLSAAELASIYGDSGSGGR